MAQPQYFYGRTIETRHGTCVAGMPVQPKWANTQSIRFLRAKYGSDVVVEGDKLYSVFADDGDLAQRYAKMQEIVDSQAKKIRDLERENRRLQKSQAS